VDKNRPGETLRALSVCIVTTSFPRWPDDSRGNFVLHAARALTAQGVNVRVIALHGPGSKPHELIEGVEVMRVRYLWPTRLEVLQNEGGGLPAAWHRGLLWRLAFAPMFVALALAVLRNSRKCDIFHAHWTLSGIAVWCSQFVHQRPFVLTVHGSDIFVASQLPLMRAITRRMLLQSQRVIAVSQALADATLALVGAGRNLEVIHNGVDVERFAPGPDQRQPMILFVGSLIERKGLSYLLRALPAIIEKLPRSCLVVVGEGPLRSMLENLAVSLGVSEHVSFKGAQSQQQVSAWMQQARVFVLPSLEEAFGVVLLEAMASGTPVVASRVNGIPEVVPADAGQLVSAGDVEALAAAITAILTDSGLWRSMSQRARAFVLEECMSWHEVAACLARVYQSSLGFHD
jgi:glycosyltransferase involved in cell wall biosynthesis